MTSFILNLITLKRERIFIYKLQQVTMVIVKEMIIKQLSVRRGMLLRNLKVQSNVPCCLL